MTGPHSSHGSFARCRRGRLLLSLTIAAGLWTGCASTPSDPYSGAEIAVLQGDLLKALTLYDAVPPGHPRYPEARTCAQAVERRMRKSQELMLEGLLLRTEWRDEEAILAFERARRIWPAVAGAEALIEATRGRLNALDLADRTASSQRSTALEPWTISTEPVIPASPGGETSDPPGDPGGEVPDPGADSPETPAKGPRDEISRMLREVENRMSRGEWESSLADLEVWIERYGEDARLKQRLARLLHQRALLRYGQGFLEAALADWHRVQKLDPEAKQVVQFMAAARAEMEMRKRR